MITLAANAKLNLFLSVVGRRPDGYHDIDSVMQQVSLADTVTLTPCASGITLTCTDPTLPTDRKNLAYRAAEAFLHATGIQGGVQIRLVKQIPMEAGLAGGSADAAAVLRGLNDLYRANRSTEELAAIGQTLGADIPFCIHGGAARTEGIGEKLTPCTPLPANTAIVIAIGDFGVSTKDAYALVDANPVPHRDAEGMLHALAAQDLQAVAAESYNVFSAVAPPSVEPLRQKIAALGATVSMMSGTGSSVFGIFAHETDAKRAKERLLSDGFRAFLCHPIKA